jgi:hypothetical protein
MSRRCGDRIRRLEYAILIWVWSRAWYDHAHSQISDERINGLREGCANMYFESNPMTNLVT